MSVGAMGYSGLPPAQAFLSPYARQQTNRGNPILDSLPSSLSPTAIYITASCVLALMLCVTIRLFSGCRAWGLERLLQSTEKEPQKKILRTFLCRKDKNTPAVLHETAGACYIRDYTLHMGCIPGQ